MKEIHLYRPIDYNGLSISQWYGENPLRYQLMGFAGHPGLDYPCKVGTSVYASHAGVIITAKLDDPNLYNGGYGLYVRIQDEGYNTIYAHLSEIHIKLGDIVTANQVIGLSGDTGNSTGPHLHWGIRLTGVNMPTSEVRFDPMQGYVNPALFRDIERQDKNAMV